MPKPNTFVYADLHDRQFYVRDKASEIARWEFFGANFRVIADTSDYMALDPILGTADDFKYLLDEIHKREMHVILDGVFNHVGQFSRYFNKDGYFVEPGAYQGPTSKYFHWFDFEKFPDEYNSWWSVKDLPVVNKGDTSFRNFIYADDDSVINHWNKFGVDG